MKRKTKLLLSLFLLVTTNILAQIPAGYYDEAANKTGSQLRSALESIIDNHTVVSYNSLHYYYEFTDKKTNDNVWDMYSTVPGGSPAYEYSFSSADQCGNYSGEGSCYNREHSFPKSWYNDASPMYSDMFSVYPTDGYVNSQRGNLPYGEVSNSSWTSTNGSKKGPCSYPGYTGTVFEPIDEYKGDFARTYFYMATRYYSQFSSWNSPMLSGNNFSDWAMNMLVSWHEADPVSQKEIDRNNAVHDIQGNRNPFIDHPEYVCKIWTSYCGPVVEFTSSPVEEITAGQEYTYNISVNAEEQSAVNISCNEKPGWLSFTDNGNGSATLSGTPGFSGSFNVELNAEDGNSSTEQSFTITVNPVPANLEFVSTPDKNIYLNENYSYDIQVYQEGSPSHEISIFDVILPQWLNFSDDLNGNGNLSGTPQQGTLGTHTVQIRATDGTDTVTQHFTVEVQSPAGGEGGLETFNNFNEPGSSYESGTFTGQDGSTWTYKSSRGDRSIDGTSICFGKSKSPAGQVISGTISGGITILNFDYRQEFSTAVDFDVYVNDEFITNITHSGSGTKNSGDIPVNIQGDFVLKFIQANSSSGQLTLDNISWTSPSTPDNNIPEFTSTPVQEIQEGNVYTYSISCNDVDAQNLEINCNTKLPGWLQFTDNGDGTATLSGTSAIPPEHIPIVISVSDGISSVEQSFTLTVNRLPVSITKKINTFSIYPVPFDDKLIISVPRQPVSKKTQVSIFDISGHQIIADTEQTTNSIVVHFKQNLSKGLYICKVQYGNQVEYHKIIKK